MLYVEITNIGFSSGNMYEIDAQGNYKFIGSNVVTFQKLQIIAIYIQQFSQMEKHTKLILLIKKQGKLLVLMEWQIT